MTDRLAAAWAAVDSYEEGEFRALIDVGRSREAAALALEALAPHLPRYQRSLAAYARSL